MSASYRSASRGFALVEVLVSMVILAFGLLAIAGLFARSYAMENDATERAEAALFLQDMVDRINANRKQAASYVTGSSGVSGGTCSAGATTAQTDLCQWANLLAGTNEQVAGTNGGVLPGAVGCIYQTDAVNNIYVISVAWLGTTPTFAPVTTQTYMQCGLNAYGSQNENLRRIATATLRIGKLN